PGLQGNSVFGVGIVASSQSKTEAGAAVSNLSGGPGITIPVVNGVPPLVVNPTTTVANLNADLLDGTDASAFSRLLAMRIDSAYGSIVLAPYINNDNYFYSETFAPDVSGRCLVTVGSQITGPPTVSPPP